MRESPGSSALEKGQNNCSNKIYFESLIHCVLPPVELNFTSSSSEISQNARGKRFFVDGLIKYLYSLLYRDRSAC